MPAYELLKFLHVLTVVFMSAPLYNLAVVTERARFGKAPVEVDRYFENLIKGNAPRCFAYQSAALITGLLLAALSGQSLAALVSNRVLLAKLLLLLGLSALLSFVHFGLQPRIDELLSQVQGGEIPKEIADRLAPLRGRRRKLAGVCLFVVITIIVLGMQVYSPYGPASTLGLVALAALFSWRAYRTGVRYGWF